MQVAIIGAGIGGLVAGALLQRAGHEVRIFEQAPAFSRLGAGINLGPNVMKVLRQIELERPLLDIGLRPRAWTSRDFRTGEILFRLPLRDEAEALYGAPYLLIHRGDFHAVLCKGVREGSVAFGKQLTDLTERDGKVDLFFSDGDHQQADIVIGADGVNSRVRETLLGPEVPRYTGYVAHRAILPREAVTGLAVSDDLTKWWSDLEHGDAHIVVYYLDRERRELYFVTGVPQAQWAEGLSHVDADMNRLRATYVDFHPEVRRLLAATVHASVWPLFERDPLPLWSRGRIVLLGDACHPMKPHMGQGAAMAIEDAAVLARVLSSNPSNHEGAFASYERARKDRTSLVQKHSRENRWLRQPMDPGWVFAYDPMTVELP